MHTDETRITLLRVWCIDQNKCGCECDGHEVANIRPIMSRGDDFMMFRGIWSMTSWPRGVSLIPSLIVLHLSAFALPYLQGTPTWRAVTCFWKTRLGFYIRHIKSDASLLNTDTTSGSWSEPVWGSSSAVGNSTNLSKHELFKLECHHSTIMWALNSQKTID